MLVFLQKILEQTNLLFMYHPQMVMIAMMVEQFNIHFVQLKEQLNYLHLAMMVDMGLILVHVQMDM
jgi:hypothetical protein